MKPKHTVKHWLIAGALFTMPWSSHAAGLGPITVVSALGQPLRAEIDLIAVPKDDVDLLVAKVASADDYRRAGLERPEGVTALRFSVEKRPNGQPYLKVTSSQPVNEPYLQLMVQLDWPSGRVLRTYTVLLDPPGLEEQPAVATVAAPTVAAASAKPAPEPAVVPARAEPAARPSKAAAKAPTRTAAEQKPPVLVRAQPAPALTPAEQTFPRFEGDKEVAPAPAAVAEAAPAATVVNTYKVKRGDSLAKIAQQFKPEGYSLEQMLVSLFEANRQAFEGNNMNRLKSGQILRVPDATEVAAVNSAAAAKEVRAHAADWHAYRQKLAAAAAAQPAEEAPAQEAAGKITAKVEDKAPQAAEPAKDVLKLSKGEAPGAGQGAAAAGAKAGAAEGRALQDKLDAAQEEAAAKQKALAEANSRIAELEKNIQDMKRLLEAQNQQLAQLQKRATATAETAKAPPAAQPAAPAVQPAPTPVPATPAPPAEVAKAPEPAKAPEVVAKAPEAPKPAPKPVRKAPQPVEPVPEPSFLDELLGNPLYLAGGGAVAIGGLLAALWAVGRRRKKSLASFEDSIMTGGDLKANTVFGNTGGGQIDTGDTSFLTDFSQGGMGAIDTNDVDPIAEAEVYMAYGRDAQAEEILKEAISKDPSRHEVQLKLLEIYAGRRNQEAFETVATELYAATGGQGPIWEKAAELGRSFDPNNPLYARSGGAGEATPAAGAAAPAVNFALNLDTAGGVPLDQATVPGEFSAEAPLAFDLETAAPVAETAPPAQEQATQGENTLEFDLDTLIPKAVEKQEAEAASRSQELGFDLPELDELARSETTSTPASGTPASAAATTASDNLEGLDFNFDFETPAETKPAEEPTTEALMPELDLSGLDLEMPGEMNRELAEPAALAGGIDLEETPTVAGPAGESWEEASTKLDLARAYVEMGDKEGAREILEEVIQEGGPEQQADAKKLLASLA